MDKAVLAEFGLSDAAGSGMGGVCYVDQANLRFVILFFLSHFLAGIMVYSTKLSYNF